MAAPVSKIGRIPTFQSGDRLHSGEAMNLLAGPLSSLVGQAGSVAVDFPILRATNDNLTANAGGGQANATQLGFGFNRLATVVTAGDSALLPPSRPGLSVFVVNSGAASAQVFGTGSDVIGAAAANVGVSQASGKTAMYFCLTAGQWFVMSGA